MRNILGFQMKEPEPFHNPFFLNLGLWFSTWAQTQSQGIPAMTVILLALIIDCIGRGEEGVMVEFNFL